MANVYSQALAAIASDRNLSNTNRKKASALALIATNEPVHKLLAAASVNPSRFSARALYASEKVIKFVAAVSQDEASASAFNENALATFKTIVLSVEKGETKVTFDMLRAALSKDIVAPKGTAERIFRRQGILSPGTLNAQSQQCRDMLLTLGVAKETAKGVFEIQTENPVFQRAQKQLANVTL